MKILYIMVENTANTLPMFVKGHEQKGNTARFLTLFKASQDFEEDICLDLPLLPNKNWFRSGKDALFSKSEQYAEAEGYPPTWNPGWLHKSFFYFRDLIWAPLIMKAIKKHKLDEYDVYHLEGGHGLLRMFAWPLQKWHEQGKGIVINYHGADMRTRGVFPWIDDLGDVHTTSELDLMDRHPNMKYVFLPFDVKAFQPKTPVGSPLVICHATRDRYWKGSDVIIQACEKLVASHGIHFDLIENQPYEETLRRKSQADIYVDQVSNLGGWGYGMNSVEALSMGLACATNLLPEYEAFIPDHPFQNVSKEHLYDDLKALVEDPDRIRDLKAKGRAWVEKTHAIEAVMNQVYALYEEKGWLNG